MTSLQHNGRKLRIDGYATLFGEEIYIGSQTEKFATGAFTPSLRRGATFVRATINHRRADTWASVRDGSLRLWEDSIGLAFSAALPATPEGRGLARAVADGLIQASVLFRPFRSKPTPTGCVVETATLIDVCLAIATAYPTATWLSDFGLMRHMSDRALLLRRCLIGAQLKARREARDHVMQPCVAPSHPARRAPSRAEQAVKAYHEAKSRRPLHTRARQRRAA